MEKLLELYKQWKGAEPLTTEKLPGAGSNRAYYRMTDTEGKSVIGCIGTSRDENHAFVYMALFDKFLISKIDLRSNFVATQQSKNDLFSAFAAPKFGSFVESYYLCTENS